MKRTKGIFFWSSVVEIYQQLGLVLRNDPTICILFILIACIDFLALTVLFFAHTEPVSTVVAPIISTFWSERFLHYPENFYLLPKLFNHAHFLITTLIGIVVTGLVIKKIDAQVNDRTKLTTFKAFGPVMRKYLPIILAWLISYGVVMLAFRVVLPYFMKSLWLYLAASYVTAVITQSLVAFLIPAIVLEKSGFFKALWTGTRTGFVNIPLTSLVIAVPMLLGVALSYFKMLTPVYLRVCPELVLVVLASGVVVMTIVDLWVTASTTLIYLKVRNER